MRRLASSAFVMLLVATLLAGVASFAYASADFVRDRWVSGSAGLSDYWDDDTGAGPLGVDAAVWHQLHDKASFKSWWGKRPEPKRDGGDYLAVLSRLGGKGWTSSYVLGAAVINERAAGRTIGTLIIPEDTSLLYAVPDIRRIYPRADGTHDVYNRATFRRPAVQLLTGLPLVEIDYDPVLTEEQLAEIERRHAIEVYDSFSVVQPGRAGESTWVLHAGPGEEYVFYLLPASVSPVGDEL